MDGIQLLLGAELRQPGCAGAVIGKGHDKEDRRPMRLQIFLHKNSVGIEHPRRAMRFVGNIPVGMILRLLYFRCGGACIQAVPFRREPECCVQERGRLPRESLRLRVQHPEFLLKRVHAEQPEFLRVHRPGDQLRR